MSRVVLGLGQRRRRAEAREGGTTSFLRSRRRLPRSEQSGRSAGGKCGQRPGWFQVFSRILATDPSQTQEVNQQRGSHRLHAPVGDIQGRGRNHPCSLHCDWLWTSLRADETKAIRRAWCCGKNKKRRLQDPVCRCLSQSLSEQATGKSGALTRSSS